MDPLVTGTVIFLVTYALIVSDKIDKTLVALAGGLAMVLFQVASQETAFRAIDFNVIFLLAGMMIIANITGKTGIFQWAAVKAAKAARGEQGAAVRYARAPQVGQRLWLDQPERDVDAEQDRVEVGRP